MHSVDAPFFTPDDEPDRIRLSGISSMATRPLLAVLVQAWQAGGGVPVRIESVGGVEAARRVAVGAEPFDLVFLADEALDALDTAGRLLAGSRVALARSSVAAAIRAGAQRPDLSNGDALRAAVLAAPTIAYSTGPSGIALLRLFQQWGIAQQLAARLIQAPPGVPVGALVARGDADLGFQQRSELITVAGIEVLGPLPAEIAITTVFGAAVLRGSTQPGQARRLLAFMASDAAAQAKRDAGLAPADDS